MRILLAPGNNSLSHIAKCLAIDKRVRALGHDVLLAVSSQSSSFLDALGFSRYVILPDIQESDLSGLPTVEWFRRKERITASIQSEVELMRAFRPDRVLNVFRFTLKASSAILDIPCYSLICGCMLPEAATAMGFHAEELGRELQEQNMREFYRYCGSRMSKALESFGLPAIHDVREMLKGVKTFLWDFPEFYPLSGNGFVHVGPIFWNDWPRAGTTTDWATYKPLAIVSFGTTVGNGTVANRIAHVLTRLGYKVLVAAGNQKDLSSIEGEEDIIVSTFEPLCDVLRHASLIVTHGGQITIFEALWHKVPVVVMPFQPEQAENGVCLERLGCGRRLIPARPFRGNDRVYMEVLDEMSDDQIAEVIISLVKDPATSVRLAAIKQVMAGYRGVETITEALCGT